jgi:hypothetical protein
MRAAIASFTFPSIQLKRVRLVVVKIKAVMENLGSNGCSSDLYTCTEVASSDTHPDLTVINNGIYSRVVLNVPSPRVDSGWRSVVIKGGIEKACRSTWAVNKGISALFGVGNAVINRWSNRWCNRLL